MSISQSFMICEKRVDKWKKSSYNPTYKTRLTKRSQMYQKGGFHWELYNSLSALSADNSSVDGHTDKEDQ